MKETICPGKIVVCAVIALIESFGMIAGGLAFIGIPLTGNNVHLFIGGICILWGLFLALLLLTNCDYGRMESN